MDNEKLNQIQRGKGFIAALDQSGGSTPKALANYGIPESAYSSDEEMFELVHQMRTRVITSPAFNSNRIIGTILFEKTMESNINGKPTADYLWRDKHIVSFLKVDDGLQPKQNGVQMMKQIPELADRLAAAKRHGIFGTKMRSVIYEPDTAGIKEIVDQQFTLAKQICANKLVPIIEPEVSIGAINKAECEDLLKSEIQKQLQDWDNNNKIMFKFTIPDIDNLYLDLYDSPAVIRIVALSGGYSINDACARLARNHNMPASFSRALLQNLQVQQTDDEFNAALANTIEQIYSASID